MNMLWGKIIKFFKIIKLVLPSRVPYVPPAWLSADKLAEHMQLTKPLLNVEDYQYRNCPKCGGKGTPLAQEGMYQCDECKFVYEGYKHE
jgi:NADH pyrophosphatase NudC (nudix superfamily)